MRRRGDLAVEVSTQEVLDAERSRSVTWWYFDEGRRFGLEAELPAAQGKLVAHALERIAEQVPAMPDEEHEAHASARRADALVALCSARIASDSDPDRATVIVHAQLQPLRPAPAGASSRTVR